MRRHALSDAQWERIKDMLPANGRRGRQWLASATCSASSAAFLGIVIIARAIVTASASISSTLTFRIGRCSDSP